MPRGLAWIFLFDQKMKFSQEEIRVLARKNAELDLNGMLVPETKTPAGAFSISKE